MRQIARERDRATLYAVNFFMADMSAGMGPFLGVLLRRHHRVRRQVDRQGRAQREERNQGPLGVAYCSFTRSVTLPAGANEEDIKATYDKGILTVDVALPEQAAAAAAAAEKHITVQAAS